MEMRAIEPVPIGQDLTPPLPPLAFSLHDSFLPSHCSACFSLLPSHHRHLHPATLYCSPQCSNHDSHLRPSTAEHHLLLQSETHFDGDTSDLRTALRLLRRLELLNLIPKQTHQLDRLAGLMTNREKLMDTQNEEGGEIAGRIRDGAKAMAKARRMRDGFVLEASGECSIEEAALCVVITNAVEVQISGGPAIGIAVYNTTFSWINHSCSPNSCYWFSLQDCSSGGDSQLRIGPSVTGQDEIEVIGNDQTNVTKDYGPRIKVRSIKAIGMAEEVSVAYTDLLQPKATRQLELWLKYRFICSCCRCDTCPLTYVDRVLQEISPVNCSSAVLCSNHNSIIDEHEVNRTMSAYVDDAITEYLTFGNPKTCCQKLENLLAHGFPDGLLHPLHHLAMSAYTTLASAYKTWASDLLVLDEHQQEGVNMIRYSAAYSLLLAGATHHLFLSESSLISSAATFWLSAGDSLMNLVRSSNLKLFPKRGSLETEFLSFTSYRCYKCGLVNGFHKDVGFTEARDLVFEDTIREFLSCIERLAPVVWTLLIHGGQYLNLIKNPVDFEWVKSLQNTNSFRMPDLEADAERSVSEGERWTKEDIFSLFQLGVHCLQYGGFLSSIYSGGHPPHWIVNIQNIL